MVLTLCMALLSVFDRTDDGPEFTRAATTPRAPDVGVCVRIKTQSRHHKLVILSGMRRSRTPSKAPCVCRDCREPCRRFHHDSHSIGPFSRAATTAVSPGRKSAVKTEKKPESLQGPHGHSVSSNSEATSPRQTPLPTKKDLAGRRTG